MAGIGIIGLGAVGSQLVQRLNASKLNTLVYLYDTNILKTVSLIDEVDENFISSQSPRIENEKISTLIITSPPGQHLETAQRAIKKGISIISKNVTQKINYQSLRDGPGGDRCHGGGIFRQSHALATEPEHPQFQGQPCSARHARKAFASQVCGSPRSGTAASRPVHFY